MENNKIEELKKIIYENNDEQKLISFLKINEEELLKIDPILLIGYHVDFYLQKDMIKKGLEVLAYYKQKPYISMEVEEFMNELQEKISEDAFSNKSNNYTNLDLENDLFSDSIERNINGLRNLSNMNIRKNMDIIEKYLSINKDEKLHRILLIILVEQGISSTHKFFIGGVYRNLTPSKITLPFDEESYKNIVDYISNNVKDPDSINRLIEIYSTIVTMSFPDNVFISYEQETILNVLIRIEKEMLGYVTSPSSFFEENELYESAIIYFC